MSSYQDWSDSEIRAELRDLDANDDVSVSSWEADFIDSILKRNGELTARQREKAIQILEKYLE